MKLHIPLRLLAFCLPIGYASTSLADYDIEMMRALGLPSEIADYFSSGAKFPAGKQSLLISVNGQNHGRHEVNIDKQGEWQYDAELVESLGLHPCKLNIQADMLMSQCYQGSRIDNETGNNQLILLLPERYIRRQPADYEFGGHALMLNYTASRFDSQNHSSDYAALETGFNSNNWLFRHNGTYNKSERHQGYTPYNSYLQRTLTNHDAMMRLGRATLSDSLYSGITLDGLQWLPDSSLSLSQRSDVPVVEGIAESQAKVEIFQNGRLVYATQVQPGTFRLTDIPAQFDAVDLSVTVTESNGSRKQFIVPYLTTSGRSTPRQGSYSLALGRTHSLEKSTEMPFITGSFSLPWLNHHQVRGGSFLSRDYRGIAAGYSVANSDYRFTALSHVAQSPSGKGTKLQLNSALPLIKNLKLNAGYSIQSERYRSPTQLRSPRKDDGEGTYWPISHGASSSHQRQSYSLGLGWHHKYIGNLSLGVTRAEGGDKQQNQRVYAFWNRQFGAATVGVSLEKERSREVRDNDTRVFATLSLPLGKNRRYSANMISNGRHRSISNSLSGQALNGDLAYGLNATQGTQSNNGTYSGNVNYLSPFTTLSGSYSHLSENQQAFYYSASGSLVADSSGLTLSPQKIGDTFGVLTIPGLAGISVSTPGGKVKTYGKQGKAVIPRLREYQPSLINVDTSTLPPGADIDNGVRKINLARGSVKRINIGAINTLRAIVQISYADGTKPAIGSMILDEQQRVVAFTNDQGAAFIEHQKAHHAKNDASSQRFSMKNSSGQACYFAIAADTSSRNRAGISHSEAVCR
ncbi:fimbria/pilus outer membrane usher protein [Serratia marcescens]|uniref:fimbria/pilus outer membrane usher protein n=1 Tax=Serratia marcescens TaxID=615 RepID=UPI0018D8DCA7|nr:fimbria/pilus outer membrane usher protein [Serratia marcescens]MBH3196492.1 fimbrial biogenesis outer membrane usher protein [Serratia marcescens]MDT0225754.1 fimbria/pilus outer membrane usher protein [Serratia marcescens]